MARFRFPVPCPERWDEMRPTESGRFCARCDKTIVDLSRLRERDASLLVALSPGLCARLAATALIAGCGTPAPEPVKPKLEEVRVSEVAQDPDPDRDGILSIDDLCRTDAEDKDGFEDEDGCPDLDNDGDKIADADDQCPNEPETYNGSNDLDGCPDRVGIVIADLIEVPDRITFPKGSSALPATELVAAIATLMTNNPQLAPLHIRGHATPREKFRAALARQRAVVVRDALIAAGIDPGRLVIDIMPPKKTDQPEVDFHLDP
jgi:outer membrane protein OmpA-like peptidoglycan-associated protein